MRDLLTWLVASGARVVNMSWGRFEGSYRRNLEDCAPAMSDANRRTLARYTVDTIRAVLRAGIAAARSHVSGTSFATPVVAGTAAKILSVLPELSGAEVRALLEQTTDTNSTGQRLLYPARAVQAARAKAPANHPW